MADAGEEQRPFRELVALVRKGALIPYSSLPEDIEDLVHRGYAERVPDDEVINAPDPDEVWYRLTPEGAAFFDN